MNYAKLARQRVTSREERTRNARPCAAQSESVNDRPAEFVSEVARERAEQLARFRAAFTSGRIGLDARATDA